MSRPSFAQWLKSQRFEHAHYAGLARQLMSEQCCLDASRSAEEFGKHFKTHNANEKLSNAFADAWRQYEQKNDEQVTADVEQAKAQSTGHLMQRFANAMQEPAKLAFIEGYRKGTGTSASNEVIWELVKEDFQKWWQTIGGGNG